ncbi:MAG: flavodoxin [Termitinemataceae bacterium]|nr:MAG: flavodoxin [Termitinemataceae bacterium]
MKKIIMLMTAVFMLFGCNERAQAQSKTTSKALIVYYSHTGNVSKVAEQIKTQLTAQKISVDVFEIKTVNAYPKTYQATVDQVKQEKAKNFKPPIVGKVANWDSYDVVFVGTPVWYQSAALPVLSFLAQYDFSNKTVIPFCTYISSGIGNVSKDISASSAKSKSLETLGVRESDMNNVRSIVSTWLRKIGIVK